jgi:peptidoglycan hydrolase-like protein with peptidoglycan-binding domain
MDKTEIYESLIQRKGFAYAEDKIRDDLTHYRDPIDTTDGRLAGNSHIAGDASPEVQSRAIDALIEASQRAGLSTRETAYVLAIARLESGFNPDAAAGPTSAYGLGQFVYKTGEAYGITDANRGDVTKQAEALVAHFQDNARLVANRGFGEEYIYKYHHDGPGEDYGGLAISQKRVMPVVDDYEKFVSDYEKKYDKIAVDPTFYARNHGAHRQPPEGQLVIRQGAHNEAVGELQSQLNQLGYTDSHGRALSEDKRFGSGTKFAVESFQRDHGLEADGVVGSDTRKAIKEHIVSQAQENPRVQVPARLDDPAHPDNDFYCKTRDLVHQLDQQNGRTPDQRSDQLAAALTVQARADGLQRIDQVALSQDAGALWGAQRPPGVRDHFFDKHCRVDTVEGLNTPMEQSGARWPQAMEQFQQQEQAQKAQPQQAQEQAPHQGPAMRVQ